MTEVSMINVSDFNGDSGEYEFLETGIAAVKNVGGLCVEIGLRLGRGMATIINAIAEHSPEKIALSIDPYGSILYEGREGRRVRLDYTNSMRNTCLGMMYPFSEQKNVRWHLIELTDADFFEKYSDGVILYDHEREVHNQYSFVHFDGPHNIAELQTEINFFLPRMSKGGMLCFDDITPDFFDIEIIENYMGDKVKLFMKGQKKGLYEIC